MKYFIEASVTIAGAHMYTPPIRNLIKMDRQYARYLSKIHVRCLLNVIRTDIKKGHYTVDPLKEHNIRTGNEYINKIYNMDPMFSHKLSMRLWKWIYYPNLKDIESIPATRYDPTKLPVYYS